MPTNPPFPAVTIKSNFQAGDKPNQVQFEQLIDGIAAIDSNSPLNNFTATTDPTVNNDSLQGYTVGSRWINTSLDLEYSCISNISGAAIWELRATSSIPDGSVTTAKIADSNVTLQKVQNINTSRVLGRSTVGLGVVEQISLGSGLSISGGVLSASGVTLPNGGYRNSYFYLGGVVGGQSSGAVTANRLYASPFFVGKTETFTRIGVSVVGAGVGACRFGLYGIQNGVPTNLLYDFGQIAVLGTGNQQLAINQSITSGLYAIAIVFDNAPDLFEISESPLAQLIVGSPSTVGNEIMWYGSHTYGSLPSVFPSATHGNAGLNCPAVYLRVV
jgi:hypothetical protein